MFLHLSVILVTGGRGCLADTPWQTPLGQTPPGRHTTLGRHPPRADPPLTDTPQETATAADGMHATGILLEWREILH